MIVHAESGFDRALMRYAGDRNRPASGAVFVADVLGGIFWLLRHSDRAWCRRARTGQGQRIDVALMDCMLNLLVYELQEAQFANQSPRPDVRSSPRQGRRYSDRAHHTAQFRGAFAR